MPKRMPFSPALSALAALTMLFAGAPALHAAACQLVKLSPNPDCPERGKARLGSRDFIAKYGDKAWEIVCSHLVPNDDFGIARPGESFGASWLVAAKGEKFGINHKTAPWVQALLIRQVPDKDSSGTTEEIIFPDKGCGCGGTSDYQWQVPASAPPGKHTVRVFWAWPEKTKQILKKEYTVTIENPNYGSTRDKEIIQLEKQFGKEKVVVLQDGQTIGGKVYDGVEDMSLTCGGYEGDHTGIIRPRARTLNLGYCIVNQKASHYDRALIKFDLAPLHGQRVKSATLKLSILAKRRYFAEKLTGSMPIFPMKKPWVEGEKASYHVDHRSLSPGMPNVYYQAYPTKWEKPLASGDSDRGSRVAELAPDPTPNLLQGARADLTAMVQEWLSGKTPNHGLLIGQDLPDALAEVHPGKGGRIEAFKELYPHGLVPFYSSDEKSDVDFRPRLVVVLE